LNPKFKKIAIGIIAVGFLTALIIFIKFFTNNTQSKDEFYVKIPTGSTYKEVEKILKPYVKNWSDFETIAKLRKYPDNVKPGRFLFKNGMSAFQQVSSLRHNMPVHLAFNNQERMENVAQRIAQEIEADSTSIMKAVNDSIFLQKNNFNKETVMAIFIPNSYEMYWNTSAEKLRDKMLDEYHKFWNAERLAKAKKLNLTPQQVVTLAAIVHKESVKKDERPKIAKVYLNRLEQGMPLQADPTVIYSEKLKDNDFNQVIKRVTPEILRNNTPYNTYIITGLPPGPIAMPDIDAIDAVLNPDSHDYLYFCASVDRFGYHDFASTYEQHQLNAKKYTDWLNQQGINK